MCIQVKWSQMFETFEHLERDISINDPCKWLLRLLVVVVGWICFFSAMIIVPYKWNCDSSIRSIDRFDSSLFRRQIICRWNRSIGKQINLYFMIVSATKNIRNLVGQSSSVHITRLTHGSFDFSVWDFLFVCFDSIQCQPNELFRFP